MPDLTEEQWRSFSAHLDQALDLTQPERGPWIAALAATDPAVAAAVAGALAASDRQGFNKFLADSVLPDIQHAGAALVGRQVGPYVIESELGRGGMGSVWRARRTDGRFEGTVAIKFVHAYWLGGSGEVRFRSEGRMLGRLDHPNIARLIDAGVLDGAQPFLVLEDVDGEPIDAYCDRLRLGVEARVELFQGVLAAVGHAHRHLIIHRDLKPANILVTREGTVKLLDFGVAKLLSEDAGARAQTSALALTPQYAAPEQLSGRPITTATDVYALGLVLYVLLTGRQPIHAEGRSAAELIHAVLTEEPVRASLAAGTVAGPAALAGDLDNILSKALRKEPGERYDSVAGLAEDLRRFLAHEPVLARPDTLPYRVTKFVHRNRGGVIGALLIALGLISMSGFALFQMQAARVQRDRALEEAKQANAQADLTQYILDDKLSKLTPTAERERLDRARQFLKARFQDDPLLAARLLIDVSGRYIDISEYRTAAQVIVEAEAIGQRFDDPDLLAQLACVRSEDLSIGHDPEGARAQLAKGLAQKQRLQPAGPGLDAECAIAEALIAQNEGDFDRAILHLRAVVAELDAAGMHGAARFTASSNDLARALAMAGRYREAWDVGSRNVELVSRMGRADTNGYLAMVANACSALRSGGQPARALAYLDARTAKIPHASDYADMPTGIYGCWALARLQNGGTDDADVALLAMADMAERSGFPSALVRVWLVNSAIARGDLAQADERWYRLIPDEQRRLAAKEKGMEVVRLMILEARLALAHQRPDDSLSTLQRARALITARGQPNNPDVRELEELQSSVLLAQRRFAEATQHAQAAVEQARDTAVDPGSSAWLGEALVLRARAEAAAGRPAAAVTARQALPHLTGNLDPRNPLIAEARRIAAGSLAASR